MDTNAQFQRACELFHQILSQLNTGLQADPEFNQTLSSVIQEIDRLNTITPTITPTEPEIHALLIQIHSLSEYLPLHPIAWLREGNGNCTPSAKQLQIASGVPGVADGTPITIYRPDGTKAPICFGFETGLSDERKAKIVDGAFAGFVGNQKSVRRLKRSALLSLDDRFHICSDQSFALLGPASTGKSTLARMFAQAVGLPFIEIHPLTVQNVTEFSRHIVNTLDRTFVPVQRRPDEFFSLMMIGSLPMDSEGFWTMGNTPMNLRCPPIVVFIDEVHALNPNVVTGLLGATEKVRPILIEEAFRIDCSDVCWIIATTDRGQLNDAFDTRFTKIYLDPYTEAEVGRIVQSHHPEWGIEVCTQVARYAGRIPREALDFAVEMESEAKARKLTELKKHYVWGYIAECVARDRGIDKFGMTKHRLAVLVALGQQGPISRQYLPFVANCRIEELDKFHLPPMLLATEDQPALIWVTEKGYAITEAGVAELDKREIKHLPWRKLVSLSGF